METDQQSQTDKPDQDAQAKEPPASEGDDKNEEGKSKKKIPVRSVDLPVEANAGGLPQHELDIAIEKEFKMMAEDRQEKERIDARNALEEYVYDLRSKINDELELATFMSDDDREALSKTLDETENWLYEEGEDCNRQVYHDRLVALKGRGEPIKQIKSEYDGRVSAVNDLAGALQIAKKGLDQIKSSQGKDDKYSHLTDADINLVQKTIQEKTTWLEDARKVFVNTPRTQLASITIVQIQSTRQSLDNTVMPIINKPKPKAEPPKEESSKDKTTDEQKNHQNSQQNDEGKNQQSGKEETMDIE